MEFHANTYRSIALKILYLSSFGSIAIASGVRPQINEDRARALVSWVDFSWIGRTSDRHRTKRRVVQHLNNYRLVSLQRAPLFADECRPCVGEGRVWAKVFWQFGEYLPRDARFVGIQAAQLVDSAWVIRRRTVHASSVSWIMAEMGRGTKNFGLLWRNIHE